MIYVRTCAIVATVNPKVREYLTTDDCTLWADPHEKNTSIIVPIISANSLQMIRLSFASFTPTFGNQFEILNPILKPLRNVVVKATYKNFGMINLFNR